MKLFNTLTRKLETFKPINPNHVKIYTCGPTVYDFAHIGNFTSYIYWDLLIRTLIANHYTPYRVLNLTDVGHLTSDADHGPDKLEKGAKREGKTVWEIAEFYTKAFLSDYHKLKLTPPNKICRATDYITESIDLIEKLTAKGLTYQTQDGIYFDTSKFPTYADFAKLDLEHLRAGARVNFNTEKRGSADFALWKFIQKDEDHAMRWDYLGRPGYPGWHIECSSIIHAELGETIDIHTGGIDHIPVHHTNEIAQSEAAHNRKMANYWLHCQFINIDNTKISKSLGNTYTLTQLIEAGFSPLDFKLWVLQGHYQSIRNFSLSDLESAKQRRLRWRNQIATTLQITPSSTPKLSSAILAAVSDNLNSAAALSLIDSNQPDYATWQFIDQLFGLDLIASVVPITTEQQSLIDQREAARLAKNYTLADQLRDRLKSYNLTVKDTPSGPLWQYLV